MFSYEHALVFAMEQKKLLEKEGSTQKYTDSRCLGGTHMLLIILHIL